MIEYLEKDHPLYKEVLDRGFDYKVTFTSLRPVEEGEIETCSDYNTNGQCGGGFKYDPDTDTLYTYGFGLYVIMEKGVWVDLGNGYKSIQKEPTYEIY